MGKTHNERFLAFFERVEALGVPEAPLKESNLSMPQIALLASVARQPGSHAQEVAEALGLSAPTVSVGLRKLEDEGWLRRETDPDDARAIRLFLTDKAMALVKKVRQMRRQKAAQILGALSVAEREELLKLLEKAATQLETKEGIPRTHLQGDKQQ